MRDSVLVLTRVSVKNMTVSAVVITNLSNIKNST
jgi:hypothetical protein